MILLALADIHTQQLVPLVHHGPRNGPRVGNAHCGSAGTDLGSRPSDSEAGLFIPSLLRVVRKHCVKTESIGSDSLRKQCGGGLPWLISRGSALTVGAEWGGQSRGTWGQRASPAYLDVYAHHAAIQEPFALGQVVGNTASHLIFNTYL